MAISFEEIKSAAAEIFDEVLLKSNLPAGALLVIGCTTSEIVGSDIGSASSPEAAAAVTDAVLPRVEEHGLRLAVQCCEHLNRALIVERETAEALGLDIVSVRPVPNAGGAFAATVYDRLGDPVAVEHVRALGGVDIGGTMIGMHLREVAVPIRLSRRSIGMAHVTAAYSRPKLIGGSRAQYN